MKIRLGFVSNSSSSSFCILGTERQDVVHAALKKEFKLAEKDFEDIDTLWEKTDFGYGRAEGKVFKFVGCEEPDTVGVDAEPLLVLMTLPVAIKQVVEIFKGQGIKVDEADIKLLYGEKGD